MVCLLSQRSIRGCLPLEEGQGLGLHGRPFPLSSSPRPLKVKAAPQPPAPKKDGQRDGGREGVDTKHSAGSHTNTHTAGRPVSIRCSLQCDPSRPSQPRPASPLSCRARSVGVVTARRSAQGGGRLARRDGVAPPLRLAFLPAPPTLGRNYGGPARGRRAHSCRISPPPLLILSASSRYRNLCSPCGVWRGEREPSLPFCPHGELWELREELRPEWGGRPLEPCACEGKWGFRGATTGSQPALGSLRTGRRDCRSWTLREVLSAGALALRRRRPARAGSGSWPQGLPRMLGRHTARIVPGGLSGWLYPALDGACAGRGLCGKRAVREAATA